METIRRLRRFMIAFMALFVTACGRDPGTSTPRALNLGSTARACTDKNLISDQIREARIVVVENAIALAIAG